GPVAERFQRPRRQHVVRPQVAGGFVVEVPGVVERVAPVLGVRPALPQGGRDAADAAGQRIDDPGRVQQQLGGGAVAVERVGVLVADDDEALAFRQATGGAGVVVDVVAAAGGDVVGPEADLVVVAQPVAVFGP